MSSDPTELLRALNPEPTATAPPIDALWRRLEEPGVTAEHREAGGPSLQRLEPPGSSAPAQERPRRGSGLASRVLVAGLVLVALAIGLGAVLVLHSNRPAVVPAVPVQKALPSPSRGLVGILGVLRRSQTAADRDLPPASANVLHTFAGNPVMSLVRVAAVAPDGEKVVLVPMRPRHRVWPRRFGGPRTGLRLALVAGGAGCCLTPKAIEAGEASSSVGASTGNYVVIVVPDGVARVRVAFAHPITAPVHQNVAVFSVSQAVETLSIYRMTWFGRSGQVLKQFPSSLGHRAPTPSHAGQPNPRTGAATPPCATHDLLIRQVKTGGAAGTRLLALSYKNTTSHTCIAAGFPGVTLYGRARRKLAVAGHKTHELIRVLQLKPGEQAYGGISYGETPVPTNQHCPPVTSLTVHAPSSRQATAVAVQHAGSYCGGALARPLAKTPTVSLNN